VSLVAFASDVSDLVTLQPKEPFGIRVHGPTAGKLEGSNLVGQVVETLRAKWPKLTLGAFDLEKHLPVAAGIGGGSADAAAAIRAIAAANAVTDPLAVFGEAVLSLGADIPVCIGAPGERTPTSAMMRGVGERLWRPSGAQRLIPDHLSVVLVNPGIAVPTGAVFGALGAGPLAMEATVDETEGERFAAATDLLAYTARHGNDLEAPAIGLVAEIATAIKALSVLPDCRLARMSGSGATCFGLFMGHDAARQAAEKLRHENPNWWVAASRLQ